MDKVKILGVNFDIITMEQATTKALEYIKEEGNPTRLIVTANPEIVMIANKNQKFMEIINKADMVVPDGIGVVKVSKFYKKQLPERVAGFDLMCNLIEQGYKEGQTFYLLGGKEGIVEKVEQNLKIKYPNIKIVGKHHGYFRGKEEQIINDIAEKKPDHLYVCTGAPNQEIFIYENREKLKAKLAIGLGGSFDVIAGTKKRGPKLFQKIHLEWLYSAITNPSRIKRLCIIPVFLIKTYKESRKK